MTADYEQTLHAEIKALQTERDQLILGREASDKTTDNLRERLKLNTSTGEQYESQQKEDPETAQLRKENQQLKDRLAKYEASVMRLWMTDRERRALITKLYTENYQLEFDLEVALDRLRAFHALSQRFCAAIEGHIPAEDTQNNDDLYEDP
jgi:chromosome segregation ATPase